MNKGIVMKVTQSHLIVMTAEGTFDKVDKGNRVYQVGEEIFYSPLNRKWSIPSLARSSLIVAAAVICLVFFMSMTDLLGKNKVVAYVSIDINPSVEIGINHRQTVLSMKGLNPDGIFLIEQIEYKGKKLVHVTDQLMERALEQGYIANITTEIVIAGTFLSENSRLNENSLVQSMKKQIENRIYQAYLEQPSEYYVATIVAPVEIREKAEENGISAGKYAIYLEANSHGFEIPLEQFLNETIHSIASQNEGLAQLVQTEQTNTKEYWKQLVEDESSRQSDKNSAAIATADQSKNNEEKNNKEEERQKQEEEKRKKDEEKRKQEAEKQRLKEEEKRKQEEEKRKKEEEKRKQEEEKRKQEEEKRKKEEEKRKQEAEKQRKKEEEKRKQEEEKRKVEEEKRKQEAEKQRKKEEQKRKQEAEKQRKKEEEKRKKEAEKRKQ